MKPVASTVLLVGSVSLLATRLVAPAASAPARPSLNSSTSSSSPSPFFVVRPDPLASAVQAVNTQVDRLRERMPDPPQFPEPVRDPFRFGGRREPERPRPASESAPEMPSEPVAPPAPALPRLVAILSDANAVDAVRTAVLAVGDDVALLKPGEVVMSLRIDAVSSDGVVLSDPATGSLYTLPLQ